ncbi:hypothetical protein C8Q80DRAFT_1284055 [Daedaleopsis nitida]|nr:hypothetical protein C8Q80DRAFT_1284055 [Daedaleopsis nitida]
MPNVAERWGPPQDGAPTQMPHVVPTTTNSAPPNTLYDGSANPSGPPADPLQFDTPSWATGDPLGLTLPFSVNYGAPFPGGEIDHAQHGFQPQNFQSATGHIGNAYGLSGMASPSSLPLDVQQHGAHSSFGTQSTQNRPYATQYANFAHFPQAPQAHHNPQQTQASIGHLQTAHAPRVVEYIRGTYHRVTFGNREVDAAMSYGPHGPGYFVPDSATSSLATEASATPPSQARHLRRHGAQGVIAPTANQAFPGNYQQRPTGSTSPRQQAGFVQGSSRSQTAGSLSPTAAIKCEEQSAPKTKKPGRKRSRTMESAISCLPPTTASSDTSVSGYSYGRSHWDWHCQVVLRLYGSLSNTFSTVEQRP